MDFDRLNRFCGVESMVNLRLLILYFVEVVFLLELMLVFLIRVPTVEFRLILVIRIQFHYSHSLTTG